MTVEQLISELQKYPADTQVLMDDGEGEVYVDEVVCEVGLFYGRKVIIR